MNALLQVEGLARAYDGVQAVSDVSFQLDAGEMLAVIGPNGAGKSTCFNMLHGQIRPDRGSVRLDGRDITGKPARTIWRLGVGRTFQISATFSSMIVADNLRVAVLSHAGRLGRLWGCAARAETDRVAALLPLVGMEAHAARPCAELAYGDLKRLELAVALASEPKLLLMDEPTAGMAPRERVEVMRLTARIARERRIGVLFTEHDMDAVFQHADRVIVLDRGRLIAQGRPDEVRRDERVREAYLGRGLTYAAAGA